MKAIFTVVTLSIGSVAAQVATGPGSSGVAVPSGARTPGVAPRAAPAIPITPATTPAAPQPLAPPTAGTFSQPAQVLPTPTAPADLLAPANPANLVAPQSLNDPAVIGTRPLIDTTVPGLAGNLGAVGGVTTGAIGSAVSATNGLVGHAPGTEFVPGTPPFTNIVGVPGALEPGTQDVIPFPEPVVPRAGLVAPLPNVPPANVPPVTIPPTVPPVNVPSATVPPVTVPSAATQPPGIARQPVPMTPPAPIRNPGARLPRVTRP